MQPITIPATPGTLKVTEEQWKQYLSETLEDSRGNLETYGPWGIPVKFQAPAISIEWDENHWPISYTFYGQRTLGSLKESGYNLEGRVSISGKKVRGFTSSLLCELPDGKLLETSVIHCCKS